jgi:hypothetical protein
MPNKLKNVSFKIVTAASMKMIFVWEFAPCSLVEVYDFSE